MDSKKPFRITNYVGFIIFPDLKDYESIDEEIISSYEKSPVEAKKIKMDAKDTHYSLIWDFVGEGSLYGGNFKCFLYNDKKIAGHFHYVKEANMESESVNGTYTMYADKIKVNGVAYLNNVKQYGIYMYLETKK